MSYRYIPRHFILPKFTSGYTMGGYFSVVLPEVGVNLVSNPEVSPSGSTATGWTATGAPYVVDTTDKVFGLNSIGPNTAAYNHTLCTRITTGWKAGQTATVSFYLKADADIPFRVTVGTSNSGLTAPFASHEFTSTGDWQRVEYTFTTPTSLATAPYICIMHTDAGVNHKWRIDGVQYENSDHATTFISGNLGDGYGWTGSANASSSYRQASVSNGGRIVNLSDLGLKITGFSGLGLPEPEIDLQPYAGRYGSAIGGMTIERREFSISGVICGKGICDLLCTRAKIGSMISSYGNGCAQPITMRFQPTDSCGVECGECLELKAFYSGGMDGNFQSLYSEEIVIEFVSADPYLYACEETFTKLSLQETVQNATFFVAQGADGNWQMIGDELRSGPTANEIRDAEIGPDGALYISGSFLDTVGNDGIGRWDGENMTFIGDTNGAKVYDLAPSPDGWIYVAMQSGTVNGPNNTISSSGLCRYNTRTGVWQNLALIMGGEVRSIDIMESGAILMGGTFSSINGTVANNVGWYYPPLDLASALGSGLGTAASDVVNVVRVGPDGKLWAGGTFANGTYPVDDIANISYYENGAWRYVDVPILSTAGGATTLLQKARAATVNAIEFDGSRVYIGGRFDQSTQWNDLTTHPELNILNNVATLETPDSRFWNNLDNGVWDDDGAIYGTLDRRPQVYDLEMVNGSLYVAGLFDQAGAHGPNVYGTAIWDGGQWLATGIEPPPQPVGGNNYYIATEITAGSDYAYSPTGDGENSIPVNAPNAALYVGGPWYGGQMQLPAVNDVDLDCGDAAPVIEITGPIMLTALINHTNGSRIDFAPTETVTGVVIPGAVNIPAGQKITIDLTTGKKTITDSTGKSRYDLLSPGSVLGGFSLDSGVNQIQVATTDLGADGSVVMRYRKRYLSADAVCSEACR